MSARDYDAVLVDLDGTLVNDDGVIPAGTVEALRATAASGVRVMVATGRSELAARHVLEEPSLDDLAVVYNGAAVYSKGEDRLVEERLLSNRTTDAVLAYAEEHELLAIAMRAGGKFATEPRDELEREALFGLEGLQVVGVDGLPRENLIRVTLFDRREHGELVQHVREAIEWPAYYTSFPLSMLVRYRHSPLAVVDVHPPCRGKAESLRVLEDAYGIPAERVVAIGDAMNDVPMLEAAGLGVGMEASTPDVVEVVDRVIGSNNSDAIGELLTELFGAGR